VLRVLLEDRNKGISNAKLSFRAVLDCCFRPRVGRSYLFRIGAVMSRNLHEIAGEIRRDWTNPNFGAVPYLNAMASLENVNQYYGQDDARGIVLYFLANAGTWRGDTARRIKKELKAMI